MARKAFIVAIDKYPNPYALKSQINDKNDLVNTLVKYYSFTSVTTLLNSTATKAAIISKLTTFIKSGVSGDSLVFAFMGHGSRIPSTTEKDKFTECICPYDVLLGRLITDKDLKTILAYKAPGVNCDVILSCCYSGGGTRTSNISVPTATIPEDNTISIASVDAPPYIPDSVITTSPDFIDLSKMPEPTTAVVTVSLNHVLWAACKENQISWTVKMNDGSSRSLFMLYLCWALRNYKTYTRIKMNNLVVSSAKKIVPTQEPQIEGTTTELNQLPFK